MPADASPTQLQLYSLGQMAENMQVDPKTNQVSWQAAIIPIEAMNFVDGELKARPTDDTVSAIDATGASHQTKVTTDNTILATWFPQHSNRLSPPLMRRGERVQLYRYADSDRYLWAELGMDMALRAGEVAQYGWNATPDKAGGTPSKANSYFFEVNTLTGVVTFSTSKANNEKVSFTIQLNPKDGKLTVMDDMGQSIYIDSANHLVHLVNADQSSVTLDKQNIHVVCQDTLELNASNEVHLSTKTLLMETTSTTLKAQTVSIQASDSATIQAGSAVNITAPTVNIGGASFSSGKLTCSSIASSGLITTNGLNSSVDIHAPNV